jgi:hypothetical protein
MCSVTPFKNNPSIDLTDEGDDQFHPDGSRGIDVKCFRNPDTIIRNGD